MDESEDSGRIDFDSLFLEMAMLVSERSGCLRMQVGCIITSVDHSRILSYGYNGSYAGGPNECERPEEPGNCGCDVHAEVNAIAKCDNYVKEKVFYVTSIPCRRCAALMVNSGAVRVVCITGYRSTEGLDILDNAGVDVEIIDPDDLLIHSEEDDEEEGEED